MTEDMIARQQEDIERLERENTHLREALRQLRDECDAYQGPELRDDPDWGPLLEYADIALS